MSYTTTTLFTPRGYWLYVAIFTPLCSVFKYFVFSCFVFKHFVFMLSSFSICTVGGVGNQDAIRFCRCHTMLSCDSVGVLNYQCCGGVGVVAVNLAASTYRPNHLKRRELGRFLLSYICQYINTNLSLCTIGGPAHWQTISNEQ